MADLAPLARAAPTSCLASSREISPQYGASSPVKSRKPSCVPTVREHEVQETELIEQLNSAPQLSQVRQRKSLALTAVNDSAGFQGLYLDYLHPVIRRNIIETG